MSLQTAAHGAIHSSTFARLGALPHSRPTLAELVRFGKPPLTPSALLSSARATREIIPRRLARRILALQNLPYIVVSNHHVQSIYQNYVRSFQTLDAYPPNYPQTLKEEAEFTQTLAEIVGAHTNTIPILARGFLESGSKYMSSANITNFLERHLRARIGTRLIAEQHLALHQQTLQAGTEPGASSFVGIIDMSLSPKDLILRSADFVQNICEIRYGIRPDIKLIGNTDCHFAYIPMHLEYMLTELFKNSFRASIESGNAEVPVEVTIAPARMGEEGEILSLRIRDRGGGIDPDNLHKVWDYSFTTFYADEGMDALAGAGMGGSSIAGLGYGLPLSRAYAEYFGGELKLQSCYGWGTDVYLTLKGLGKSHR